MRSSLIVVFIAIVVMVAHSYALNLQVSIVPKLKSYAAKQDVEVTIKYKNTGSQTYLIYNWYLPDQELTHPLFQVTRDGKTVPYTGALAKRRLGFKEDTFSLKAGEVVSGVVSLSSVYDMNESGSYDVKLTAHTDSMVLSSTSSVDAKITESDLESASVTLYAEGRLNPVLIESERFAKETRAATYGYVKCSSSRQSAILVGLKAAKTYATNTVTYLNKLTSKVSTRYTTWFGKYSSSNLALVKTQYTKIKAVFDSKPMIFSCECSLAGTYAYVYPSQPYKIYLCPVFWTSPTSGTDSKGGTLVHETSHFTAVAGTQDYAYGQTACKALAKSSPAKAVMNADSHEYFAENNPVLT